MAFAFTPIGVIVCARSCAITAASLAASITPCFVVPGRVRPSQVKTGMRFPPLAQRLAVRRVTGGAAALLDHVA